jgi:hypothetical protein
MRYVLALALGFSLVALSGVATTAQEKKTESKEDKKAESKTIEGKMVCGKCKLSETDACSNVVVAKEGDKEVKYYLTDKGKAEKYHKCSGEASVKVTGKVGEKDGKKTIEDAKVEAAK